jgi:hypothetical protein
VLCDTNAFTTIGFEGESHLAGYLRYMMEDLNYSNKRSFVLYLGVSYSTINRLQRGARVDPDSLQQIADTLHVLVETCIVWLVICHPRKRRR